MGTMVQMYGLDEAAYRGTRFPNPTKDLKGNHDVLNVTRPEVIRLCNRYGKPIASGAFTPTEALLAHESGSDFVKIFPSDQVGPVYIKNLLAPLPMLQIIPTGGVTPETAAAFIHAGSVALGVGSSLVSKAILKSGDWAKLTALAAEFVQITRGARTFTPVH